MNGTRPSDFDWGSSRSVASYPFYHSHNAEYVPGLSDTALSVVAPVVCYWSLSLFFHYLDVSDFKWLAKYRLHESAEVKQRNLVTRSQVVWGVIIQQVIQTALGIWWLQGAQHSADVDHVRDMWKLAPTVQAVTLALFGQRFGSDILHTAGADVLYFVYWWAIPIAQFFFAMFIIDTWQYCLHRGMHVNKFLYKHLHSWHHRLYVPYAYGALYNHPIEGFLLDTLGAAVAEALSGMTIRQAALLFAFSTFKTVDDHCGYNLPFDPLQWISGNNADYHDIHHQVIGIKSNFSQPFFVHWDTICGTKMTRQDIARRREAIKKRDE